ncbi:hypothetical protein HBI56_046350 [Parastagonospora nodorum]|uniref:Uncharacterized protein n=1 Tax=Phaeosphaeria nodorum (strain SN15 / ATCC MYA-4574 / FGSC 10173) TaxID=321614 RepID=A0A7U2HXK9_PHANO|nr:hypothetical protein HBH56_059490 [Parastagonospora nodorum]QRC91812.1 hypothetical protein JI435_401720 [Parastagonospora nodorum SN15]KAH3930797.1 hypothetical protein HBH54_103420 [Parastagonospora nodorum]KAH3943818.1 hypothetical protein HBH53_165870 [Parastagonospora nodorum]KAH3965422.1 hypothetical protein HBH51_152160 [Parastagonospora nodorum]
MDRVLHMQLLFTAHRAMHWRCFGETLLSLGRKLFELTHGSYMSPPGCCKYLYVYLRKMYCSYAQHYFAVPSTYLLQSLTFVALLSYCIDYVWPSLQPNSI